MQEMPIHSAGDDPGGCVPILTHTLVSILRCRILP